MDAIETLIPPEKTVNLNGKNYIVAKLGFKQIVKLARFASQLRDDTIQKIKDNTIKGLGDFPAILEAIIDDEFAKFLSIILKEEITNEEVEKLSFEEISELAKILTEVNDFEKIIANFTAATGNTKKAVETIKSLFSPSSEK